MPSNLNGVALATFGTGCLLLYTGVTGKSMLKTIQTIVQGKSPALLSQSYPIAGTSPSNLGSNTASNPTQTGIPGGAVASPNSYQEYAFSQFPSYGWGTDQEKPLVDLWNQESGWNPNARNPSSGAAGIPQDITGNMHGGWQGQIDWGLNYIKQRYGSPAMAWAHEVANNWY